MGLLFSVFAAEPLVFNKQVVKDPLNLKYRLVTPELVEKWMQNNAFRFDNRDLRDKVMDATVGDTLGVTYYDYATNSVTGRMMSLAPVGVHFTYMNIADPDADRFVTYDYYDYSVEPFGFIGNLFLTDQRPTGWGRVTTGANGEAVAVSHGGGVSLWVDDGEGNYNFTEYGLIGAIFPSIDINGTKAIVAVDANIDFAPDTLFLFSDYTTGAYDSKLELPWFNNVVVDTDTVFVAIGSAELWPVFNPSNPNEIGYVFSYFDAANDPAVYPGGLFIATSPDMGSTWNLMEIYTDGEIFDNEFFYLPENFSQYNNMYTSDGVFHVVFNGYGGHVTGDSIDYFIFPVVYTNSRDQRFVELTDPVVGRNPALSDQILEGFPGNGIGNAYPAIAAGPDDILAVIWQQVELVDDNTVRMADTSFYATDIYCAVSTDGGANWSAPFKVAGEEGVSDVFPNIASEIEKDENGRYWIHFLYMVDESPGVSLFGQGVDSTAIWIYKKFDITDFLTSIEDGDEVVAGGFELYQNFPNPFNPSTKIEFFVDRTMDVTLEVFNVLGEKVATLVNGKVKPGKHEVVFEANNLASGIYMYRLKAGDQVKTRKMMLMK